VASQAEICRIAGWPSESYFEIMNANSTFSIGKDHIVCEDYALAYSGPAITYAIVSDGCSASPEVDFGARCLAMSAKRELRLNNDLLAFSGKKAIANAQRVIDVFPYLSPQFLDATLLVAAVNGNHLLVEMYGDGVMVHRKKSGITAVHIQLSSGAPDYLSYHLDPIRKQAYDKIEDNEKVVTFFTDGKLGDGNRKGDWGPFDPFIYDTTVEVGDVIAVISDGINSFRRMNNDPIPWQDLIEEFTGYKTFEGEFVLRRIAAFKRKCLKEGITHSDDISVGAIVI
jgi:hypothetical protein